jgi:hypothetical protein
VALGGSLYAATKSWPLVLGFVVAEVAVDVDHVWDHLLFSPRPLRLATFMQKGIQLTWSRMVYLLHSYELVLMVVWLAWFLKNDVLWGVATGYATHMLIDEVGNRAPWEHTRIHAMFYFLLFRLRQGFLIQRMCRFRATSSKTQGKPMHAPQAGRGNDAEYEDINRSGNEHYQGQSQQ